MNILPTAESVFFQIYKKFSLAKLALLLYNSFMNAKNFNAEMRKIINSFNGERKKLLLHACCAPCSSACLERLKDFFEITVFFYNPNIEDEEYFKRKTELVRFIGETGWAEIFDCEHDVSEYYSAVRGYENCEEGGERCKICFKLRLNRTAQAAKAGGFDYFGTTLTISPLKDAAAINGIGERLAAQYGVSWLYSDFKKENGYLRSLQLSKEHSLYRQNYCGCVYSQNPLDK